MSSSPNSRSKAPAALAATEGPLHPGSLCSLSVSPAGAEGGGKEEPVLQIKSPEKSTPAPTEEEEEEEVVSRLVPLSSWSSDLPS